jgi:hypothetical protein
MPNKYISKLGKLFTTSKRVPRSEYTHALCGARLYMGSDITTNLCAILRTARIRIDANGTFAYSIDPRKIVWPRGKKTVGNPEAFPDLIVRVWGFSAYKDLPKSYQNLLIERALAA